MSFQMPCCMLLVIQSMQSITRVSDNGRTRL